MSERRIPGAPALAVTLRRSGRARRISLRVSQLDGRVTLTVPNGVPEAEALAFARDKAEWIQTHLARRGGEVDIAPGSELPVEGTMRRIAPAPGRRIVLERDQILVPEATAPARLHAWLKTLARDRLVAACDTYAAQLGRGYTRITLRDTRSRWGSCTSDGALMFSWRLILAAPEVLTYVAAHEVAHLAEMNHSPAFWRTVERLYGDYRPPRAWLRAEGSGLHRYRF